MGYYFYFDSGTSNTRGYLLDENLALIDTARKAVGSKDSAIAGSNRVLIDGLYEVYQGLLDTHEISDAQVTDIYASGMITSPYGFHEVPHLPLPLSARDFARAVYAFEETSRFHRKVHLIPGMKTVCDDIAYVNNVRGEETELLGLLPKIEQTFGTKPVAVVMPGSHTHVMRVCGMRMEGIISNFTGELFCALKDATILAPVLGHPVDAYDEDMVSMGVDNLRAFGFNRALYIAHAMRLFDRYTPDQRVSYAEGVVLGDVCQSLDCYCAREWRDLTTCVIVADAKIAALYETILRKSATLREVCVWPTDSQAVPALEGLRTIVSMRKALGV